MASKKTTSQPTFDSRFSLNDQVEPAREYTSLDISVPKADPLEGAHARLKQLQSGGKDAYMVAVPLDDTGQHFAVCFIEKPSRPVLSKAVSEIAAGRLLEAAETIFRSCWIEGDQRIMDEDELFMSAATIVQELISFRQAILKKK